MSRVVHNISFQFTSQHSRIFQLLLFLPVLEMKTTDFGKVVIKGENANAFIAVNSEGALYTTVRVHSKIYINYAMSSYDNHRRAT